MKRCRICEVKLTDVNIMRRGSRKTPERLCKPCHNKRSLLAKQENKLKVMNEYGGKCACCGEKNIVFLTIDHIDGNGAQERKKIASGNTFYIWLKRQGYPKDNYQILCWNCNAAKHILGTCPHQQKQ